MRKTAEANVMGAVLRTIGRRFLLSITAVGIGMSGLGEVATAIAGSTASRGLAKLGALDRTREVVAEATHSAALHKTTEASAGAASGMSAAKVWSGRDCFGPNTWLIVIGCHRDPSAKSPTP